MSNSGEVGSRSSSPGELSRLALNESGRGVDGKSRLSEGNAGSGESREGDGHGGELHLDGELCETPRKRGWVDEKVEEGQEGRSINWVTVYIGSGVAKEASACALAGARQGKARSSACWLWQIVAPPRRW